MAEYVDIDENGEEVHKKGKTITDKALEPKTPLQKELLSVSGAKGFSTTTIRGRWRKLEARGAGADPDSRVFKAWLEECIRVGLWMNKQTREVSYEWVIRRAENEAKAREWMITNRAKVLKKKTVEDLKKEVGSALTDAYLKEAGNE